MVATSESERHRYIHRKEESIAAKLRISATSASGARLALGIPANASGTIVDLASGASPLVASLATDGADAYGVDRIYSNPIQLQKELQILIPRILATFPPGQRAEVESIMQRSLAEFIRSYGAEGHRYLSDWLTKLSLPDSFADMTVSLNGISDLAENSDVFSQAISEALRITKPGGTFTMAPYHTSGGNHTRYASTHARLTAKLQKDPTVQVRINPRTANYWDARLRIIKL